MTDFLINSGIKLIAFMDWLTTTSFWYSTQYFFIFAGHLLGRFSSFLGLLSGLIFLTIMGCLFWHFKPKTIKTKCLAGFLGVLAFVAMLYVIVQGQYVGTALASVQKTEYSPFAKTRHNTKRQVLTQLLAAKKKNNSVYTIYRTLYSPHIKTQELTYLGQSTPSTYYFVSKNQSIIYRTSSISLVKTLNNDSYYVSSGFKSDSPLCYTFLKYKSEYQVPMQLQQAINTQELDETKVVQRNASTIRTN